MEHRAPLSSVQPWRLAALVAAAVATLELVLIVAGIALVVRPFADSASAVATTSAQAKRAPAQPGAAVLPPARLPRSRTSVIVLNGNGRSGAAGEAAGLVRALDYLVAGTANAPRTDFARSIVMYRPGYAGEAARLARDLRVKRVTPLDGLRAAHLEGAHVALILGRS